MKRALPVCCAILAGAGAALAASYWSHDSGSGGDSTAPVNCGQILGTAGAVTQWSVAASTDTKLGTHSDLGAKWSGTEAMHGTAAPIQTNNTHFHEWAKNGGGIAANSTLRAEVQFDSQPPTGSAGQANAADPSWWWMPHVLVHQGTPGVQKYNPDTGEWDAQSWVQRFGPNDEESQSGVEDQGQMTSQHGGPTPSVPHDSTRKGHDRCTFSLPPSPSGTRYRVKFPFTVDADADSDNAKVTDWQEKAHADTSTEMNSSNPNTW